MEPNVKTAFEEILKCLDSIDERCSQWEKSVADVEVERKELGAAMERRVAHLEESLTDRVEASVNQIHDLEEYRSAASHRLGALEQFCSVQAYSAIVSNNWGREIEQRVEEVEYRVGDLELARLWDLYGENDDRVMMLEAVAATVEEWRPYIDGSIDDMRLEIRRLKQARDRTPLELGSIQPGAELSPAISPVQPSWDRTPLELGVAHPGAPTSVIPSPVLHRRSECTTIGPMGTTLQMWLGSGALGS